MLLDLERSRCSNACRNPRAAPTAGADMAAVKLADETAPYIGCELIWRPGAWPFSSAVFDNVRPSGMNASLTTIVLLPVPLRPTVYQSSMISMSSRGISSQRRSGGPSTPSRLIGTAAVSQLQWSTPLEKKPRPDQQ